MSRPPEQSWIKLRRLRLALGIVPVDCAEEAVFPRAPASDLAMAATEACASKARKPRTSAGGLPKWAGYPKSIFPDRVAVRVLLHLPAPIIPVLEEDAERNNPMAAPQDTHLGVTCAIPL